VAIKLGTELDPSRTSCRFVYGAEKAKMEVTRQGRKC